MSEEEILEKLHEAVLSLGITCERSDGEFRGGICRLHKQRRLMLNSNLPPSQEIDILCQELAHFDLSNIFLLPALRRKIEIRSGVQA